MGFNMKQIFGFKYAITRELDYVDEKEFTVFPIFSGNGVSGYYIESRRVLRLDIESRVILRSRLSKDRIRDISVRFFIPTTDNHQEILSIVKSHDTINLARDTYNNLIAEFNLDVLPSKRTEIVSIKQSIELSQFKLNNYSEIKLKLREKSVGNKYYLRKEIMELAEKLRSDNDLVTLTNCVKFVKSRVKYVKNYFRLGALFALKQGKGACDEITDLCASVLEALGYDVRVVIGYVIGGGFHAWLEVNSENYGWVPIDPTMGLIGGIGLRWIKFYSELKPNQKIITYSSRPKKLYVSLEYYLEGEKLS